MAKRRSTLWADVVVNLAVLTAVTVILNALLMGSVSQGREAELRRSLAAGLSADLALRTAALARRDGVSRLGELPELAADFAGAQLPDEEPFFAVVADPSLTPLAKVGRWPDALTGPGGQTDALLQGWLVQGPDVRSALVARRTERGEWQADASFFGRVWAVASSPVVEGGRVLGVVRVAVPVGVPFLGPVDRRALPVLLLSVLVSSIGMGAFGFFLFRRRILLPVEQLLSSTNELGRGRFETRLPDEAADELGELARAFNRLASRLQESRSKNDSQLAELRAINEDLSQAREDLIFAEKMATVGRLAAGVAHEVGNPLASVVGFVELLQQSPDDRELADDLLPRVRKELDRIHGIIRDLLSYARPTGQTGVDWAPVSEEACSVAEVVETAAQLVAAQKRFAGVTIDIELAEDAPRLTVPADRLQQVILNLLVNAAEAMGGEGRIRVWEVDRGGGFLTVAVQDDGPGVDPRAGSNIFEPFFTTKEVGQGTGLGLAVSLRLAERMGGKLRHIRDPGVGACFHLSLPVAG